MDYNAFVKELKEISNSIEKYPVWELLFYYENRFLIELSHISWFYVWLDCLGNFKNLKYNNDYNSFQPSLGSTACAYKLQGKNYTYLQ